MPEMNSDHPARLTPALADIVVTIDDLTSVERRISPAVANPIALDAAYQSYQTGRLDAIRELKTVEEVAPIIGIAERNIRRLAAVHEIGWRLSPRVLLFRPEDVERLRTLSTGKPGRPRKAKP